MIDYKERYYNLWSKFLALSLRDSWLLEEEIGEIDEQIRRLKIRRNKLIARKHAESKERLEEEERRKVERPILYLPFTKKE